MSDFVEVEGEEIAVECVRILDELEHYRRHDEVDLLLPIL
jgi:hypothetical protein